MRDVLSNREYKRNRDQDLKKQGEEDRFRIHATRRILLKHRMKLPRKQLCKWTIEDPHPIYHRLSRNRYETKTSRLKDNEAVPFPSHGI